METGQVRTQDLGVSGMLVGMDCPFTSLGICLRYSVCFRFRPCVHIKGVFILWKSGMTIYTYELRQTHAQCQPRCAPARIRTI